MSNLRCLAIEDEPHALHLIHHYVDQIPYLTWIGGWQKPLEALPLLTENKVDLLILDINLPGVNGMSFYRSLALKPPVIFTTAYSEYAVEGFSVEAVDYLVKPILFERFIQACNRVYKQTNPVIEQIPEVSETVYVKSGAKWFQLLWQEVLYLEKDENYVIFHTADGRKILTRQNLTAVEQNMPSFFCRTHKSFIVNLARVEIVEREQLTIGDRTIPLADTYRSAFMKANRIG